AARWQSNAVAIKRRPIDLEAWLKASYPRWLNILGPGARLERGGDPLPLRIQADPRMLALITDNLMDNARKFSKETPEVQVTSKLVPARRSWQKPRWEIRIRNE